ncbi:MAG TPA: phage tail tube protein, partial [Acetobacteraceae bacterium]|nr:phage tail tube protein [Acetobacteraceae bacterium]
MSGSTSQSLGIIDLIWGGTKINVDTKSATFQRGGLVSTPVVAGRTVSQGQQFVAPKVSAKFPLMNGMSLDTLIALNGTEMQIKCDSGQTYIINGAFFSGDPKVTGGPGSNVSAEW